MLDGQLEHSMRSLILVAHLLIASIYLVQVETDLEEAETTVVEQVGENEQVCFRRCGAPIRAR
eukprot:COSAG01_NODE_23279_length_821_cov_0.880886_2_plen_63_part_00